MFTPNKFGVILTSLNISGNTVLYENRANYLGITLDTKLDRREHLKRKRTETSLKELAFRDNFQLVTHNKIWIYNQITLIWLYSISSCSDKLDEPTSE